MVRVGRALRARATRWSRRKRTLSSRQNASLNPLSPARFSTSRGFSQHPPSACWTSGVQWANPGGTRLRSGLSAIRADRPVRPPWCRLPGQSSPCLDCGTPPPPPTSFPIGCDKPSRPSGTTTPIRTPGSACQPELLPSFFGPEARSNPSKWFTSFAIARIHIRLYSFSKWSSRRIAMLTTPCRWKSFARRLLQR